MKTAISFLVALVMGLSASVVVGASSSQSLGAGFYYDSDGRWHDADDGTITSADDAIYAATPDKIVLFEAHPSPGSKVQHWFVFPMDTLFGEDGPGPDANIEYLAPYSDSVPFSWNNGNHKFGTTAVYVCVRFYYITNSVVFHAGAAGTTGSTASSGYQCYTNSYALTPNGFLRTGYTFSNWTNESGIAYSDGQTVSGSSLGVTNNMQVVNLYAVWTAKTSALTFSANGGTGTMTTGKTATYGQAMPTGIALPTKTGYSFSGFYDATSGGTKYYNANGSSARTWDKDTTSGTTLYAQWTAKTSALTFSANGGTGTMTTGKTATYGQAMPTGIALPTKTGYSFSGFYDATSGGTKYYNADGTSARTWNKDTTSGTTLYAHWTANTTAVHFNNYNAQGGASDTTIAYDAVLESVSPVPYWPDGSRQFLGYYTGAGGTGDCYWDKNGQAVRDTWDIDSATMTFYAHYEENVYHITYEPNGGTGEHFSVLFTNGTAIALSDGAAFSRHGSELLGWARLSTVGAPEYQLGEEVVFSGMAADFNLYAVWQDFYYVAFDGNGATNETPMAIQKFASGESKALSANEYGKVGYSFVGWSTNEVAASSNVIAYVDCAVVKDLEKSAGATNTLFASWWPISYVTAFDASKHSSEAIAPSNCIYGVEFPLPTVPYNGGDLWQFVGWSNAVANVVYYTDEVSAVSNLCTTAGATNTLVAVWESMVGPLSEAMDIYDLRWENENPGFDQSWQVVNGFGHDTESCVSQTGKPIPRPDRKYWEMTTSVTNSGTLTFWWKSTGAASLYYYDEQTGRGDQEVTFPAQAEWTRVSIDVEFISGGANECTLHLGPSSDNTGDADTIYIDRMTWTPDGSSIEPTPEDARDISGISFDGGVLSLSFTNADERFSYNLRGTNDLVAPLALWPVLWTTNGTGTITITPPLVPSAPQFFYYLETTAK